MEKKENSWENGNRGKLFILKIFKFVLKRQICSRDSDGIGFLISGTADVKTVFLFLTPWAVE